MNNINIKSEGATYFNINYIQYFPFPLGVFVNEFFIEKRFFYYQYNENIKNSILGNLFLLNYKIVSFNNDTVEYCVPIIVRKNNNIYEIGFEYPDNIFNPLGNFQKIAILINKKENEIGTFFHLRKRGIYSLSLSVNDLYNSYIKFFTYLLSTSVVDLINEEYYILIKNYVITNENNEIIERIGEHKYSFLVLSNNLDGYILGKVLSYDEFRKSLIFYYF